MSSGSISFTINTNQPIRFEPEEKEDKRIGAEVQIDKITVNVMVTHEKSVEKISDVYTRINKATYQQ